MRDTAKGRWLSCPVTDTEKTPTLFEWAGGMDAFSEPGREVTVLEPMPKWDWGNRPPWQPPSS